MLCTFTSVLIAQLCLTLCNPKECSPPGSSIHGILQARVLEWVAIPFSRGSSLPRDWTRVFCIVGRFFTVWDTREAPNLVKMISCSIQGSAMEYVGNCSLLSCGQLFATPWTVAIQAPLSMGFSGQECWSGLPCPPPGDLSHPGIEPESLTLAGRFFATWATWEAPRYLTYIDTISASSGISSYLCQKFLSYTKIEKTHVSHCSLQHYLQ